MDSQLQALVDSLSSVSDLRNLDRYNPVIFCVQNTGTNEFLTVACSIVEPSPLILPINGRWINLNTLSPDYKKVFQLKSVQTVKVYTVDSEASMLALAANQYDVVVRSDTSPNSAYRLDQLDPTVLSNWTKVSDSTDSRITNPIVFDPYSNETSKMTWKPIETWSDFLMGFEYFTVLNKGDPGINGADGAEGPKGDTGQTGPRGAQGPQGPQGLQGPAGPTGPIGPQGPAGPTGPRGPRGLIGMTGPQGNTGPQGPAGADGVLPDWISGGVVL